MKALSIREVRKRAGSLEILKGINIEAKEGEFLILVGPSGCGKSTLLNMIAGLDSITSGEIHIGERNVTDLSPKDRDIAMVFQSYALYPNMTVAENIAFGMEMRKVPKSERDQRVKEVAKTLQIEHLLDRKPSAMSGGQRQRVAMGRALARRPSLYLFDEPLSNLDAKLRVEMRLEIKLLHERMGTSIVYVTHDQIEAMTLGQRIAVMRAGEVVQLASPKVVYEDPNNMYVAGFIGSPAMNFLEVKVVEKGSGLGIEMDVEGVGASVLPAPDFLKSRKGEKVILGLRPEAITNANSSEGTEKQVPLNVKVLVTEPTGPDTLVFTRINKKEVVCRCHPDSVPSRDAQMNMLVDMGKAVFFDVKSEERIRG